MAEKKAEDSKPEGGKLDPPVLLEDDDEFEEFPVQGQLDLFFLFEWSIELFFLNG